MKKLLLTAAVAVSGLSNVNAQDQTTTGGFAEGDVYVSGNVGFNSTSQDENKSNTITFSPTIGYFISEHITMEFNLIVGSSKQENGDIENKSSTFGAGLGATYFFTPSDQFSFTVGAGVSYRNSTFEPDGAEESKIDSIALFVSPGINYFVSDCIALRASTGFLQYGRSKADFEGAEASNSFGLNLNLSNINFGITYKF